MAFASGGSTPLTHTRLTRWQESGPQGAKIDREFLLRIYRFTLMAHGTYTVSISPEQFWYIFYLWNGWSDLNDILHGETRDW